MHMNRFHKHSHKSGDTLVLAELPGGTTGLVRSLDGGKELTARLAALGITPGAQVTILQNFGHGPLTVAVLDTRLALGRGEARRVIVELA